MWETFLVFFPQVKIASSNEEMLRAAVEQFVDKTDKEIEEVAMLTLEGHQRAIMGAMTVDEIFKDRKKFSTKVFGRYPSEFGCILKTGTIVKISKR